MENLKFELSVKKILYIVLKIIFEVKKKYKLDIGYDDLKKIILDAMKDL